MTSAVTPSNILSEPNNSLLADDIRTELTTVAAELTALQDGATQAITAAGAIDLTSPLTTIVGPASSTYAVTLAAPGHSGRVKVIRMLSTTSTNAVTLALTNVTGGSAATTATFNAANEVLTLVSASTVWVVVAESGVTLA